jgi:flagellar motor protein MotB
VLACLIAPALAVDAQHLSVLDGGAFPALREADAGGPWEPAGAFALHYGQGLVDLVGEDGATRPLLAHVVTQDQGASLRFGRTVRLGVGIPIHRAIGWGEQAIDDRWGDLSVWLVLPILDRPFHLAWWTQVDAPTGSPGVYLGDAHGGVRGTLAAGTTWRGWEAVANLGVRLATAEAIPGQTWGKRWEYGLGLRRTLFGPVVVNGELFGSVPMAFGTIVAGSSPSEALLTVGVDVGRGFVVHAGAGGGLTDGLGSPSLRAIAMVDARRRHYPDADDDGIADPKDGCPTDPEDEDGVLDADGCPEEDPDGDGILDAVDRCALEPEVVNGHADYDGCPDALGLVRLTVESADPDVPLETARVAFGEEPAVDWIAGEPFDVEVAPGRVGVAVVAEGFRDQTVWLDAAPGETRSIVVRLAPVRMGAVALTLVDPAGAPLPGFVRHGAALDPVPASGLSLSVPSGPDRWRVFSPGFAPKAVDLDVPARGALSLTVTLSPSAVRLVGTRIETRDEIPFDLDRAEIRPDATETLEEIAALLQGDPRIALLRIEGHADESGSSAYNLELSRKRAESIRGWLVGAGVDPDRLESIGTGEARPREGDGTSSRRVEFLVLVWADEAGRPPDPEPIP